MNKLFHEFQVSFVLLEIYIHVVHIVPEQGISGLYCILQRSDFFISRNMRLSLVKWPLNCPFRAIGVMQLRASIYWLLTLVIELNFISARCSTCYTLRSLRVTVSQQNIMLQQTSMKLKLLKLRSWLFNSWTLSDISAASQNALHKLHFIRCRRNPSVTIMSIATHFAFQPPINTRR